MEMLATAPADWTIEDAAHLLNRAGFGGAPRDIEVLHGMGRHAAVEHLLAGTDAADFMERPEWARPAQVRADLRRQIEERRELQEATRGKPAEEAERLRREFNQRLQRETRARGVESQGWWFRRMLHTKAPLREKMALFWHDHFASSLQKVRQPVLIVEQNELFRRHALGSFRELTRAVAADPAMMLYLDTQTSRKGRPNENFARELMELFTLGEGHYNERDVREAARAFTGYQFNRVNGRVSQVRRQWDEGEKTILGTTSRFDGPGVIELIFRGERPAAFLAEKLWRFFVAEDPPTAVIEALARDFRAADYQVKPLLRTIFLAKGFYDPAVMRDQIKSPVQFLISLLKQLEIANPPAGFALNAQQELGQVLFMPPNVAGWDWGKAWINTNTLLARYNIAGTLTGAGGTGGAMRRAERNPRAGRAAGRTAGATADYRRIAPPELRQRPEALVDSLAFRFFQGPLPAKTRGAFVEYAAARGDKPFGDREIAELCHLMLSTPHYQLC